MRDTVRPRYFSAGMINETLQRLSHVPPSCVVPIYTPNRDWGTGGDMQGIRAYSLARSLLAGLLERHRSLIKMHRDLLGAVERMNESGQRLDVYHHLDEFQSFMAEVEDE